MISKSSFGNIETRRKDESYYDLGLNLLSVLLLYEWALRRISLFHKNFHSCGDFFNFMKKMKYCFSNISKMVPLRGVQLLLNAFLLTIE